MAKNDSAPKPHVFHYKHLGETIDASIIAGESIQLVGVSERARLNLDNFLVEEYYRAQGENSHEGWAIFADRCEEYGNIRAAARVREELLDWTPGEFLMALGYFRMPVTIKIDRYFTIGSEGCFHQWENRHFGEITQITNDEITITTAKDVFQTIRVPRFIKWNWEEDPRRPPTPPSLLT